jgi:uncharacterized protein
MNGKSSRKRRIQFMVEQTLERTPVGNAATIGFIGFGLATVLVSLANAGVFPVDAMLLGIFIFLGGVAEIVAGAMLWKSGETFAMLAFTAFGLFWFSLATIYLSAALNLAAAPTAASLGAYFIMWGIFAFGMFFGTLRAPRVVSFLIGGLSLLFFILGIGAATSNADITTIGGYWGVIDGFSGVYISIALIVNETMGRSVLPLFPAKAATTAKPKTA